MEREVPIKSTKTTIDIVETLAHNGWMSLSDLADEFDYPRSTIYDHLSTLVKERYVVKEGTKYRVGSRFLDIGVAARQRLQIYDLAKPEVDDLAAETGEHASLMIEEHGLGVLLYIAKGEQALDLGVSDGWRLALSTNAPGKAILAYLPDARVDEIIAEHGLPEVTGSTITDREELDDRLETIRDRGYALDHGERIEGVRAISVPVVTGNQVHGAITISGPTNRMTGDRFEETLPDLLFQSANVIEVQYTLDDGRA